MSRSSNRGFIKKDEVLENLSVGRAGAIQTCTEAKIASPEYKAADEVMEAIDKLAGLLTGDPQYFWIKMAPAQGPNQPKSPEWGEGKYLDWVPHDR